MQDTKELKTPNGHTVLVRGFVTGLIDQEVKKIELGAYKSHFESKMGSSDITSLDPNTIPDDSKVVMETNPSVQIDADNKLLELMVLAVDGDTGDVLNKLLGLPAQDTQFVTDEVKALRSTAKVGAEEKKV